MGFWSNIRYQLHWKLSFFRWSHRWKCRQNDISVSVSQWRYMCDIFSHCLKSCSVLENGGSGVWSDSTVHDGSLVFKIGIWSSILSFGSRQYSREDPAWSPRRLHSWSGRRRATPRYLVNGGKEEEKKLGSRGWQTWVNCPPRDQETATHTVLAWELSTENGTWPQHYDVIKRKIFSALLSLVRGIHLWFLAQRDSNADFSWFFVVSRNKLLNKHSIDR